MQVNCCYQWIKSLKTEEQEQESWKAPAQFDISIIIPQVKTNASRGCQPPSHFKNLGEDKTQRLCKKLSSSNLGVFFPSGNWALLAIAQNVKDLSVPIVNVM